MELNLPFYSSKKCYVINFNTLHYISTLDASLFRDFEFIEASPKHHFVYSKNVFFHVLYLYIITCPVVWLEPHEDDVT